MAQNLDLNIEITALTNKAVAGLKRLDKTVTATGLRFQSLGKSLTLFTTLPALLAGNKALKAFDKQAKAIAQVEAGLKATAQAAGFTSQELQRTASELQRSTLFGDEEILAGATAQLLTFTNIAGEQFERTQKAALDLATRLDGDLTSASIQLGKALNDPVANLSALSRSGIQFSKEQKALIDSLVETNRLADAQTIILDELEKQYGGSAEAAARAGLGPIQQLQNSLGDLAETIGARLLPLVTKIADFVRGLADSFNGLDERTKQIIVTLGIVAAAAGPALFIFGKLLTSIGLLIPVVSSLGAALAAILSPIGLIVAGITTLVGSVGFAAARFIQFRRAGIGAFDSVKLVALDFIDLLNGLFVNTIGTAVNFAIEKFEQLASLAGVELKVPTLDLTAVDDLVDQTRAKIASAYDLTEEDLGDPAEVIANTLGGAVDTVTAKAKELGNSLIAALNPGGVEATKAALAQLGDQLDDNNQKANDFNKKIIDSAKNQAASGLANSLVDIADGTKKADESFSDFAGNFLKNITRMITESLILQAIQSSIGGPAVPGAATGGLATNGGIKKFATGGQVSGPGTGTSDSILARLSNGEFVSDAKTVSHFGPEFFGNLKRMARGKFSKTSPSFKGGLPAFASGGMVGTSGSDSIGKSVEPMNVVVQNSGTEKEATSVTTERDAKGITINVVLEDIAKNGPITRGLSSTFGIKRGGRK